MDNRSDPQDAATDTHGPLTKRVLEYAMEMRRLASSARGPDHWAPLEKYVAVDEFERVGPFLDVQNWRQCTEMLTAWASTVDSFETPLRRVSELPGLVYFEVEERHSRGEHTNVVNSLSVFEFNEEDKIRRLDVYLQRAGS